MSIYSGMIVSAKDKRIGRSLEGIKGG